MQRQLTWFRRDKRINWIDVEDFKDRDELSSYIYNQAKNKLKI